MDSALKSPYTDEIQSFSFFHLKPVAKRNNISTGDFKRRHFVISKVFCYFISFFFFHDRFISSVFSLGYLQCWLRGGFWIGYAALLIRLEHFPANDLSIWFPFIYILIAFNIPSTIKWNVVPKKKNHSYYFFFYFSFEKIEQKTDDLSDAER